MGCIREWTRNNLDGYIAVVCGKMDLPEEKSVIRRCWKGISGRSQGERKEGRKTERAKDD